eukprot:4804131-Karenia_brevis.AAC.1
MTPDDAEQRRGSVNRVDIVSHGGIHKQEKAGMGLSLLPCHGCRCCGSCGAQLNTTLQSWDVQMKF